MASIEFKRIALASLAIAALSASCMSKESLSPALATRVPRGVLSATPDMAAYPGIVSDFENIARIEGPAVVAVNMSPINETSSVKQLWPPPGITNDPFLRFFREFSPPPGSDRGAPAQQHASGFIISSDGDILTDASDIAGTSRITVTLADGRMYRARVIGSDPASGVALVGIHAKGLSVARIGSPSTLKAGEWVASIGSPYGLGNSIVRGIVSNTSRLLPDQSYVPLIQTDLTENAGEGGSPLMNLKGEVVGIETPLPDDGNVYQDLAFAIPIDEVMRVERQLKLHGKATHGRIGVAVQEVTGPLARSFGLKRPNGALVTSVDSGGPAAKAGMRAGDVIVGINGTVVSDSTHLPATVADLSPGTKIDLDYWRDHAVRHATLVLSSIGTHDLSVNTMNRASAGAYGLGLRDLTRDEEQAAGVWGGVRVERSRGPAAFAGIEPGDIILRINRTPVTSTAQFLKKIARSDHNVALLVDRNGMRMFLTMNVG
ncbi:peptidase [Burkholderia lata]|uniref:Probable periplasmic serine endoprotease DegP-like n=1 Tax=Burkholderia lata (strain ATCC 17760 / DSM 23089 / LMG 22485 / NCIMB 9086 / R18194 / 383) TaxID=482957 RepID=A0A6P2NNS1_BURL3|nr:PDZ domain-containing protein [Burkholderia lata]VWB96389.1 peptidase [Burkholderia lata]